MYLIRIFLWLFASEFFLCTSLSSFSLFYLSYILSNTNTVPKTSIVFSLTSYPFCSSCKTSSRSLTRYRFSRYLQHQTRKKQTHTLTPLRSLIDFRISLTLCARLVCTCTSTQEDKYTRHCVCDCVSFVFQPFCNARTETRRLVCLLSHFHASSLSVSKFCCFYIVFAFCVLLFFCVSLRNIVAVVVVVGLRARALFASNTQII